MNKKIAAIDLDGIILEDFDGEFDQEKFGDTKEGAKKGLQELWERGFEIVVWTCRGNLEPVRQVLEEREIPYDYINYHPLPFMDNAISRKVYADLYIDDRGLGCPTSWDKIIEEIRGGEDEK